MGECAIGHRSGFQHLDVADADDFDLGVKFEQIDTREPCWRMFVSYQSTTVGPVKRGHLHYEACEPSTDRDDLLSRAEPHIVRALAAIRSGHQKPPETSHDSPIRL